MQTIYSYQVYKNSKYGYTLVMYRDGEEVDSRGAYGVDSLARLDGMKWIEEQMASGDTYESVTVKYYKND